MFLRKIKEYYGIGKYMQPESLLAFKGLWMNQGSKTES